MHVCHPSFGEEVSFDEAIESLIDNAGRMVSTDVQLLLRDRYETTQGIFNHEVRGPDAGDHPFALILQHWNEDTVSQGPLQERIQQYLDHQILKHFGLSIDQFLDHPTYICDLLLKMATDMNRREDQIASNAEEQFKKAEQARQSSSA